MIPADGDDVKYDDEAAEFADASGVEGRGVGGDESTCCCELDPKAGTCIDIEFWAVAVLAAAAGLEASLATSEEAGGGGRRSSCIACFSSTANAELLAFSAAMAAGGCT